MQQRKLWSILYKWQINIWEVCAIKSQLKEYPNIQFKTKNKSTVQLKWQRDNYASHKARVARRPATNTGRKWAEAHSSASWLSSYSLLPQTSIIYCPVWQLPFNPMARIFRASFEAEFQQEMVARVAIALEPNFIFFIVFK